MPQSSTEVLQQEVPLELPRHRLLSLDALRGLTIGFMILVNNNGDGNRAYWALKHADWNGFTPTDLVFPTFVFLVGITTVFSTMSRLAKGETRQSLFLHALRRAVVLFLLGLLVNSFPLFHLHTLRLYGVLPRIAICYLAVASLYLVNRDWRNKLALTVVALVAYWALLRFVPVPGYGIPTHTVPLLDHDGNLTAWIDRQILPPSHLYEHTRDPEGLLSTLPAIATSLLGMLTGQWLRSARTLSEKVSGIAAAGLGGLLLGGLWNLTFPINKKLWTSSYVLFAAGCSLLLLAASIWLVDLRRKKTNTPLSSHASPPSRSPAWLAGLLVFGTNAIAAYVFSELFALILVNIHLRPGLNLQQSIYRHMLLVIPNPAFASLLYSLAFVAICWAFNYALYRRKVFIRI